MQNYGSLTLLFICWLQWTTSFIISRNREILKRPLLKPLQAEDDHRSTSESFSACISRKDSFPSTTLQTNILNITYNVDQHFFPGERSDKVRAILLLHPIGVGISRWYYHRLIRQLHRITHWKQSTLVLVPDLLACGTATQTIPKSRGLPCFLVPDWSQQLIQLMQKIDSDMHEPLEWCIISNGGCVPIALATAALYLQGNTTNGTMANIILSSPPRLSSLLRESPPLRKVRNSYRFLSRVIGNVFWWYSLRNDGAFIRKFTETNLMADPMYIGDEWIPQCVSIAKSPKTKYSTFAFLAGALQYDCRPSFHILQNHVTIDLIRTQTKAGSKSTQSWFWEQRQKISHPASIQNTTEASKPTVSEEQSLSQFLTENGNRGQEIFVRGRSCPAYEDPVGYVNAMMNFIHES
jgi:hypothetical protein